MEPVSDRYKKNHVCTSVELQLERINVRNQRVDVSLVPRSYEWRYVEGKSDPCAFEKSFDNPKKLPKLHPVPDAAMKLLIRPPGGGGGKTTKTSPDNNNNNNNNNNSNNNETSSVVPTADNKRISNSQFIKLLSQTRASLSLRGDTPMTDRDSLVFETLSVKLELQARGSSIPFHSIRCTRSFSE